MCIKQIESCGFFQIRKFIKYYVVQSYKNNKCGDWINLFVQNISGNNLDYSKIMSIFVIVQVLYVTLYIGFFIVLK